jgi:hypothetical protein
MSVLRGEKPECKINKRSLVNLDLLKRDGSHKEFPNLKNFLGGILMIIFLLSVKI